MIEITPRKWKWSSPSCSRRIRLRCSYSTPPSPRSNLFCKLLLPIANVNVTVSLFLYQRGNCSADIPINLSDCQCICHLCVPSLIADAIAACQCDCYIQLLQVDNANLKFQSQRNDKKSSAKRCVSKMFLERVTYLLSHIS